MSTVLKAIRELERREKSPGEEQLPSWTEEQRPRHRWSIALVLLALAGGITGVAFLVGGRGWSPPSLREAKPDALIAPEVASVEPRGAPPRNALPAEEQQPRGRVLEQEPAMQAPVAQPTKPRQPPAPARRAASEAPVPGSESGVQVASIAYSTAPAERSVRLVIDGRGMKLHEGESTEGLEVQLILPDRVYLRRGATVFAVHP